MSLTLEEMEREAYQRGEYDRAQLLVAAIEKQVGAQDEWDALEQEAESERERGNEAETAISALQAHVCKWLLKAEDAMKANDLAAMQEAIDQIREEL